MSLYSKFFFKKILRIEWCSKIPEGSHFVFSEKLYKWTGVLNNNEKKYIKGAAGFNFTYFIFTKSEQAVWIFHSKNSVHSV